MRSTRSARILFIVAFCAMWPFAGTLIPYRPAPAVATDPAAGPVPALPADIVPTEVQMSTGLASAAPPSPPPDSATTTARAAPAPAPGPAVPATGSGKLRVAPGSTGVPKSARVLRYRVEVEAEMPIDPGAVAETAHRILSDRRSWGGKGTVGFQRVDGGSFDFRLIVATPGTTDRLCAPLDTEGKFSCRVDNRTVINGMRWITGAPAFEGDIDGYRGYVVNHEVGHLLGHGHATCPKPGALAPVMMQQTKGTDGCRANPWPFPG